MLSLLTYSITLIVALIVSNYTLLTTDLMVFNILLLPFLQLAVSAIHFKVYHKMEDSFMRLYAYKSAGLRAFVVRLNKSRNKEIKLISLTSET